MPLAVNKVEGVMDPVEGRIVIHGHIYENGPIISGELPSEVVCHVLDNTMTAFSEKLGDELFGFHGLLTVKFLILANGTVDEIVLLVNRLAKLEGSGASTNEIVEGVLRELSVVVFPANTGTTNVIFPLGFGNRLSELR
jgi:hypothetical protein